MKFNKLLLIFFFLSPSFFSQQAAYFFLGEKEFAGVQIFDIIQDNELNYWFATDQGFYKYTNYKFKKTECPVMKGLSAFGFVKNKNGLIFCFNLNNQILKIENSVCSVLYELKEKERSSDVYLSITSDNHLLVLTKTALLFDSTGKLINISAIAPSYYGYPFQTAKGMTISHVVGKDSLLILNKNHIRFAKLRHTCDKITGLLKFFRIDNSSYAVSTANKEVYAFDEHLFSLKKLAAHPLLHTKEFYRYYNENNQLWFAGALSGVNFTKNMNDPDIYEAMYKDYFISDVYKDSEENILLSTFNHGVLVIPDLDIPDVLTPLVGQSVVSIQQDDDFGILMGTSKGQLISYQNNQYKLLSNSGNRPLQAVFSWPDFPYILFDDGEIKIYDKKSGRIIFSLIGSLKDAALTDSSSICLALNTGVCKISLVGGQFRKDYYRDLGIRSNAIEKEPLKNNMYIATSEGLKILKPNQSVSDVLYRKEIVFANDITSDSTMVYVATKNKEILVFSDGTIVRRILPSLNQKPIEVYKLRTHHNHLYALSSEGFLIFDKLGKVVMQLNKVQGFSDHKMLDFDIIENQLWICHLKGVQKIIFPLPKKPTAIPLIKLAKIEVNDQPIANITQASQFNNDQHKFRFVVSSPTLRYKENITYHYKLLGYEENWAQANYFDNEIVYNALAPGNYTFTVKVENNGHFSKPASYSFSILYPFYQRWWFMAGIVFILMVSTLLIYKYKLNSQRKKSEMINELNLSKLTAIQSQMNPHFMFNALNSIQDLVLKGDIENSYTFISKFSSLVRMTLNYSDKDFIDFEKEIELLELYLTLEKLRFKKNLEYKITIDNEADIMIPPLLIQPFIENALVHGLLHKEGNRRLSIHFHNADPLICIVEDNGIGREKAKAIKLRQRSEHASFSGKAIQKRFDILSQAMNSRFGYSYEDLYENNIAIGTRVTLTIPIKHKF
jgi:hypothetical protein